MVLCILWELITGNIDTSGKKKTGITYIHLINESKILTIFNERPCFCHYTFGIDQLTEFESYTK